MNIGPQDLLHPHPHSHMTTATSTSTSYMTIEKGLEFILSHFDDSEPIWPRMISTHATGGGQRLVNNNMEALAWFKAANLLDCRISAYPKYTDYYVGRTGIEPSILLVDIDREQFDTIESFELAATKTYSNFNEILDAQPTQLWTGNGYHFIQPQSAIVLEKIEDFNEFDQPSRMFLQFQEQLLTDNKADQNHWNTVSFNNCMLRIPGSLNYGLVRSNEKGQIIDIPHEAEVRVVRYGDGNRPSIEPILTQYYIWLQVQAVNDIHRRKEAELNARKFRKYHRKQGNKKHTINWIEKLINKPLDDSRKYCIWRIFVPYFINVRGLSRVDTISKISSWLDRCDHVSKLTFNPKDKIDDELNKVANYYPVSRAKLEREKPELYTRLQKEGIIAY
jgi:hypothetical protein